MNFRFAKGRFFDYWSTTGNKPAGGGVSRSYSEAYKHLDETTGNGSPQTPPTKTAKRPVLIVHRQREGKVDHNPPGRPNNFCHHGCNGSVDFFGSLKLFAQLKSVQEEQVKIRKALESGASTKRGRAYRYPSTGRRPTTNTVCSKLPEKIQKNHLQKYPPLRRELKIFADAVCCLRCEPLLCKAGISFEDALKAYAKVGPPAGRFAHNVTVAEACAQLRILRKGGLEMQGLSRWTVEIVEKTLLLLLAGIQDIDSSNTAGGKIISGSFNDWASNMELAWKAFLERAEIECNIKIRIN
ncbi:hypothetical protein K440DRAFT_642961 [Wilcoxina mikolae CBS 423.85]|nr:hypothetical protein K440DRAFT_642961 [Wilcoxina mikolae CBS 423.85]